MVVYLVGVWAVWQALVGWMWSTSLLRRILPLYGDFGGQQR